MRIAGLVFGLVVAAAAWRIASAQDAADEAFDTPEVKELAARADALKLDDELALLNRMRRSFDAKLLAPAESAWKGRENLRGRGDAGLARILERGPFDGIVTPRGGGAYWSFTKRSNDYGKSPQLELQRGTFSTGFYGTNFGLVVRVADGDLGAVDAAGVPEDLRLEVEALRAKCFTYGPAPKPAPGQGGRGGGGGGGDREWKNDVERPKAEVGGVYVVRSVLWDECDVLAAFEVVSMDAYGATIAWRVLKTFDVPKRKR